MNNYTLKHDIIDLNNKKSKEMFSKAFYEKAEITDRLFNTLLRNSLHFRLSINNEDVCQLFLIDSEIVLDKKYPIYYLYAASTDEKYRGLGLMHKLIEYAKQVTIQNNRYGIVLKPANSGLFKFYDSCGFKTILKSKIYEYEFKKCNKICDKISAKTYLNYREKLLLNTPHIALKDILCEGIENHYDIFGNEHSICLAEKYTENGKAFIAEHLGDDSSLNFALNIKGCNCATIKTPGNSNDFSVIWLNKIKEPQYNIYHGPCFE